VGGSDLEPYGTALPNGALVQPITFSHAAVKMSEKVARSSVKALTMPFLQLRASDPMAVTFDRHLKAMLNAGLSYCLSASEIIRQVLKKWKYSNSIFSVETFLHLVSPGCIVFG
jgi:hypothetical protein